MELCSFQFGAVCSTPPPSEEHSLEVSPIEEIWKIVNNSAKNCSILLKFSTEFEHVRTTTNVQGQQGKGKGHNVT